MRSRGRWVIASAAALLGAAALALAVPGDRATRLISGGDAVEDAEFGGATADGSRVWFATGAKLLPQDADATWDVYERRPDGSLTLISPGTADLQADFRGATADGTKVWFETEEALDPADTDAGVDVYERDQSGAVRLVTSPGGDNGEFFLRATPSGSHVWFDTDQVLAPGDSGLGRDVYERQGVGPFRLITPGGAVVANWRGFAADGSRAWFLTSARVRPAQDPDTQPDVYERQADDSIRLVTPGTAIGLDFVGANDAGTRVWVQTTEGFGDDTDTVADVYEVPETGPVRRVTAGQGGLGATLTGHTPDGALVWFSTNRAAVVGDTDGAFDVYQRAADDALTRISDGDGSVNAAFLGATPTGSVVWYQTSEPLDGADLNGVADVYARAADGTRRLVTPGTQAQAVTFAGASADGARVWFTTSEPLLPADADANVDLYERTPDGRLVLVSQGVEGSDVIPTAGAGALIPERFSGTADGSRIWFATAGAVAGSGDAGAQEDVYERAWDVPAVSAPAVTGTPAPGQPLTCAGEVATGEGAITVTRQWLRDGVAVAGATGATITPADADLGAVFVCRVTATNPIGATSAESAPVGVPVPPPPPAPAPAPAPAPPPAPVAAASPAPAPPAAPRVSARARVTGAPIIGTRMTCAATIAGASTRSVAWTRSGRVVGRAATYRLVRADLGARLVCAVTGTGAGGTATSTSAPRTIPRTCRVPALRGATTATARTRLGDRACRTAVSRVAGAGVGRGRVIATDPGSAAVRPNGATVRVRVRR